MLTSLREKAILKQGLIVIGIMAGLYVFVLSPFLKEGSSILDEELERKTTEIKRYISRTGSLPSKEGFDKLEEEKGGLKERLALLIDFVDPVKVRIAESNTEAGLYFIERLHSSIKKFSEGAATKEIELPENLGFGDGLPKENMVDTLLRQLEIVEMVVDILLKSERIEFSAIKPLKSIDYIESLTRKVLYTELPVQVTIVTDSASLLNLLLELKNKTPVVSVKEVHVKSSESGTGEVEASLVLSTFRIKRGHDLQSEVM